MVNGLHDLGESNLGVSKNRGNGWFIMEKPIKMDDLGGFPLFLEIPTCNFNLGYFPSNKKNIPGIIRDHIHL